MTKKLLIISVLVIIFVVGGCGAKQEDNAVKASLPSSFEIVAETKLTARHTYLLELRHVKTGCHYSLSVSTYNFEGSEPEQMYTQVDGETVLYCN